MDSSHMIKRSSDSMGRLTRPALAVQAVVGKLDADLRRLDRDRSLFDGERTQRKADARRAAEAAIRQHRAEMTETAADFRQWSRYSYIAPNADAAAHRMYASQRAVAELSGMAPADVLARLQHMAVNADAETTREYVAAARGRVPEGALRSVERQVEEPEARMARSWGKAVDRIDGDLLRFDAHVAKLLDGVGHISEEAKAGTAPEEPLSTRVLALWTSGLEGNAAESFNNNEAYEADALTSGVAAALPYAGTEGYDGGDQGAEGNPQPLAGTAADPQADLTDAEVDA